MTEGGARREGKPKLTLDLTELRKEQRLSRGDLAAVIGITQATLFRIEHGDTPTLGSAIQLARFFGTTFEAMWEMGDPPRRT